MSKILKVIGLLLWIGSGYMMVFALMVRDLNGVDAGIFDILKWTFAVAFVFASPYYLWTIFDNSLFLSQKGILELRIKLKTSIENHNDMARSYYEAMSQNSKTLNDMMDFIKYKDKSQRVKEIDELFDNNPMTDEIRELRYKVLKYIQNNG